MTDTLPIAWAIAWGGWLCAYDIRQRRLPNWLTVGGAAAVLAARLGAGGVASAADGLAAAVVAGLFLLLPFLMRGAGGGDVKMLFAAGAVTGWSGLLPLLWYTSVAGLVVAVALLLLGRASGARLRHYALCLFNWRYDRRAAAALLPPTDSEAVRVPFSLPIAIGLFFALALR